MKKPSERNIGIRIDENADNKEEYRFRYLLKILDELHDEIEGLKEENGMIKKAISILWDRMPKQWVESLSPATPRSLMSSVTMRQPEKSDDIDWLKSLLLEE